MIDPAHPFARANWELLMVMHDRQLPAPMSLHWSTYYQQLSVQVTPSHFLRWLDALSDAAMTPSTRDGRTYYKACGVLRGTSGVTISLTAVGKMQAVA